MRSLLTDLGQDLRYALRGVLARPTFSVVVIATLALGIGANTAIFSAADATLRRGLPYRDVDRVVAVWETRLQDDAFGQMELSYPNYLDLRARQRSFDGLGGHFNMSATLATAEGSELLPTGRVIGDFFQVLGVDAALGRLLVPADAAPDAPATAVLTYGFWQRRYGGERDVLGRTLTIDGKPATIVGVLPRGFSYAPFDAAEVILPGVVNGSFAARRNLHWMKVIGRLRPGVTMGAAQADVAEIARALGVEHPDANNGSGARLVPISDEILGKVRPIFFVLLAAVGLVLLVACANVANLVLARQHGRAKELAIRAAMGASRGRLFVLLTVDSLVHALLAGAAGVLLAVWGVDALMGLIPPSIRSSMPFLAGARVDLTALAFGLGVAVVSGLAVGVLPALRASRPDLHDRLKEEGRGTPGRARGRMRDALVVAEVAFAFVLLAGAGLVSRSLWHVLNVDPGFDPRGVMVASVVLPDALTETDEKAVAAIQALARRVEALPGVEGVATVNIVPGGAWRNTIRFIKEGETRPGGSMEPEANIREISANYFTVMHVPLAAGRFFTAGERENTLIVNRALARKWFGGDALGKRIVFTFAKDQPAREIVGVVADERLGPLDQEARPAVYLPYERGPGAGVSLMVRGRVQAEALTRAVAEVDSAIPVYGVGSLSERLDKQPWMFVRRFPAVLVGAFAALALLLAMIGIYGVLSYSVRQRTHEIGIRRAVGAQPRHIAGLLVGRSALLAAAGVTIGLVIALATTRLLGAMLFGVSPFDPVVLGGAAIILIVVALAASWLPARGALAIDPLEALR